VIASRAAIEGGVRNEAYAATKGGVISMMKSIDVEHTHCGMRANAILPGWIATDRTAGAHDDPGLAEKVIPRVPIRRRGDPTNFGLVPYLASDADRGRAGGGASPKLRYEQLTTRWCQPDLSSFEIIPMLNHERTAAKAGTVPGVFRPI